MTTSVCELRFINGVNHFHKVRERVNMNVYNYCSGLPGVCFPPLGKVWLHKHPTLPKRLSFAF